MAGSADDPAGPVVDLVDPEAQLRTRVAWLYYVEGQTQGEVAHRLGTTRVRVNRLLAAGREEGIVQIRINGKLAPCVRRERELVRRFGLDEAVVVPSPARAADVPLVLGAACGHYLDGTLAPGRSVGIGWGRTLRASLPFIGRRRLPGLSVVSLLGGLTRASRINAFETASRLAQLFDAECYYLAAPAFTSDAASRDAFLEQEVLREVIERARAVDLAVLSVGEAAPESTIARLGLVAPEDIASLRAAGAVGDLLGTYLDARGRPIDHPVNRRVVALGLDDLRRVAKVVLVSGGPAKLPALRAVLGGGYARVLITDETTAEGLLAGPDP